MDPTTTDPLNYLVNVGVLGVVLVLWLTGMIVSKRELDRANDRADEWKVQYTRESEAHGMTRRALERERERMDTTTETGRTVTALLGVLGSRSSFSPERGGT
jgi:hypothetical protein